MVLALGNGKGLGRVILGEFSNAISVFRLLIIACLNEIVLRVAASQKCCKLIAKMCGIYGNCVVFPIGILWILSSYFVVAFHWPVIWFVRSSLALALAFILIHGKGISFFLSTQKTLSANASRLAGYNSQLIVLWVIYQLIWFVSLASFPHSKWKRSIFVAWSLCLAENAVRTGTGMLLVGKSPSISLDALGRLCFVSFCEMISFPIEICSFGLFSLQNRQKTDNKILSLVMPERQEPKTASAPHSANFLFTLYFALFLRKPLFVAFNFYRLLLAWGQVFPLHDSSPL